jgi:hypothetical protein
MPSQQQVPYSKHLPSEIATEYLASSFMRLRLKSRNFADANEIICCHFFVNQEMNFEVTGHWRARLLFSRWVRYNPWGFVSAGISIAYYLNTGVLSPLICTNQSFNYRSRGSTRIWGQLKFMSSNFFLHRTNYLPAAGFASSDPGPGTNPWPWCLLNEWELATRTVKFPPQPKRSLTFIINSLSYTKKSTLSTTLSYSPSNRIAYAIKCSSIWLTPMIDRHFFQALHNIISPTILHADVSCCRSAPRAPIL